MMRAKFVWYWKDGKTEIEVKDLTLPQARAVMQIFRAIVHANKGEKFVMNCYDDHDQIVAQGGREW